MMISSGSDPHLEELRDYLLGPEFSSSLSEDATLGEPSLGMGGAAAAGSPTAASSPLGLAAGAFHISCPYCGVLLEVAMPASQQLSKMVAVRCGSCTSLLAVDVHPLVAAQLVPHLAQQAQGSDWSSLLPIGSPSEQASASVSTVHSDGPYSRPGGCRASEAPALEPSDLHYSLGFSPAVQLAAYPMEDVGGSRLVGNQGSGARPAALKPLGATQSTAFCKEEKSSTAGGELSAGTGGKVKRTRSPSPYNLFIRDEIPRIKAAQPGLDHKQAFKIAAKNWATSSQNTRNSQTRALLNSVFSPMGKREESQPGM